LRRDKITFIFALLLIFLSTATYSNAAGKTIYWYPKRSGPSKYNNIKAHAFKAGYMLKMLEKNSQISTLNPDKDSIVIASFDSDLLIKLSDFVDGGGKAILLIGECQKVDKVNDLLIEKFGFALAFEREPRVIKYKEISGGKISHLWKGLNVGAEPASKNIGDWSYEAVVSNHIIVRDEKTVMAQYNGKAISILMPKGKGELLVICVPKASHGMETLFADNRIEQRDNKKAFSRILNWVGK